MNCGFGGDDVEPNYCQIRVSYTTLELHALLRIDVRAFNVTAAGSGWRQREREFPPPIPLKIAVWLTVSAWQ